MGEGVRGCSSGCHGRGEGGGWCRKIHERVRGSNGRGSGRGSGRSSWSGRGGGALRRGDGFGDRGAVGGERARRGDGRASAAQHVLDVLLHAHHQARVRLLELGELHHHARVQLLQALVRVAQLLGLPLGGLVNLQSLGGVHLLHLEKLVQEVDDAVVDAAVELEGLAHHHVERHCHHPVGGGEAARLGGDVHQPPHELLHLGQILQQVRRVPAAGVAVLLAALLLHVKPDGAHRVQLPCQVHGVSAQPPRQVPRLRRGVVLEGGEVQEVHARALAHVVHLVQHDFPALAHDAMEHHARLQHHQVVVGRHAFGELVEAIHDFRAGSGVAHHG
mmetsp:Transcript_11491/g.21795  ORF Transcript_11491/g.21795 Transcript_11491/m.21795 type:complete len:332 (-) Transcript_11491:496-1491(-)